MGMLMSKLQSEAFEGEDSVEYKDPKPLKPTGILHFTIGVTDLDRAKDFYQKILGCEFWRQNETTVFMKAGADYFVLSKTGYHVSPNKPKDTLIHHAFIVNGRDFDSSMAWLESHGVEILLYEDVGHRSFSGRHAYFHDPDGNGVEIIDLHGIDVPPPENAPRPKSHLT
jgi:catechol 2,3-dioxygenase-like lactoylglutathione lyase family enzyme